MVAQVQGGTGEPAGHGRQGQEGDEEHDANGATPGDTAGAGASAEQARGILVTRRTRGADCNSSLAWGQGVRDAGWRYVARNAKYSRKRQRVILDEEGGRPHVTDS